MTTRMRVTKWHFGCIFVLGIMVVFLDLLAHEYYNHDTRNTIRIFLGGNVIINREYSQSLNYSNVIDSDVYNYPFLPQKDDNIFDGSIWEDLVDALRTYSPDLKIINLETCLKTSDSLWHTINVLNDGEAENLICNLANDHILDHGYDGLKDTMKTLEDNSILYVGAGGNCLEAAEPAIIELPDKNARIFIFGFGTTSALCRIEWNATFNESGINLIEPDIENIPIMIQNIKRHIEQKMFLIQNGRDNESVGIEPTWNNIVILTIHWDFEWGYDIAPEFIDFAHRIIDYDDDLRIDIIHGHSSHNIKAFEIYKDRVIFYGMGDFIHDSDKNAIFEGNKSDLYEYNSHLGFMYFVDLNVQSGKVENVIMKGIQIEDTNVNYANGDELGWLRLVMKEECKNKFGVELKDYKYDQTLRLKSNGIRSAVLSRYILTLLIFYEVFCVFWITMGC